MEHLADRIGIRAECLGDLGEREPFFVIQGDEFPVSAGQFCDTPLQGGSFGIKLLVYLKCLRRERLHQRVGKPQATD